MLRGNADDSWHLLFGPHYEAWRCLGNQGRFNIDISKLQNNALRILVSDDGVGLSDEIDDSDSIFEKGITTTSGSGLGLYNVRQLLQNVNGAIELIDSDYSGTTFEIKVYS
ncbi:ATP-binding protein [Pseudomonas syringae]|uniref:ATP-binding protein n=2 Tax=Pseudomonas syringae group TaxID=136849 RepID=UPI003531E2E0